MIDLIPSFANIYFIKYIKFIFFDLPSVLTGGTFYQQLWFLPIAIFNVFGVLYIWHIVGKAFRFPDSMKELEEEIYTTRNYSLLPRLWFIYMIVGGGGMLTIGVFITCIRTLLFHTLPYVNQ